MPEEPEIDTDKLREAIDEEIEKNGAAFLRGVAMSTSVLAALAQNNCGPQYANAARGPGSFLENLFGTNSNNPPPPGAADLGPQSGTFRTVCVRLCEVFPDGTSTLVTRALLNLTHRESDEHPAPLVPGERFR